MHTKRSKNQYEKPQLTQWLRIFNSCFSGPHPSARNWWERIFWMIVIIFGLTCASIIINSAFVQWADNPTVTTTANFSMPIQEVQVSESQRVCVCVS